MIDKKFIKEVKKSLLLEENDKKYWLENYSKLPTILVEYFYKKLKKENDVVDEYLKTAIEADPNLLNQLKNKIKKLKKDLLKLKEKNITSKENVEEYLEKELGNL